MTKILMIAVALMAAACCEPATAAGSVAGRTVKYTNSRGQTYWITYNRNGTLSAKSTKASGPGYIYDTGHWRSKADGVICERYANWQNGHEYCHSGDY